MPENTFNSAHSPIKFHYYAEATITEENKTISFQNAWENCDGKYPFIVMAIDDSRNGNDWGIPADRLEEFAAKMQDKEIQTRINHSDDVMSIVGKIRKAEYDPKTKRVFAEGWTDEKKLAKKIHHGTVKAVSMQAEATEIICGTCGKSPDTCHCGDPWKLLLNPDPIEMSFVSRGAYEHAGLVSGFRAAADNYIQNLRSKTMTKKQKLIERLEAVLNEDPAPEHGTGGTFTEQEAVPQPGDPKLPEKPPQWAAGIDEKYKLMQAKMEAMAAELEDLKKKEEKAKCGKKAAEDEKEKEKAAEEPKEEKKEEKKEAQKASFETNLTLQSRHTPPNSAAQAFKANNQNKTHDGMSFYVASQDKGAATFEGFSAILDAALDEENPSNPLASVDGAHSAKNDPIIAQWLLESGNKRRTQDMEVAADIKRFHDDFNAKTQISMGEL